VTTEVLTGEAVSTLYAHHRDFPELQAEGETALVAAEKLGDQLLQALEGVSDTWHRESVKQALEDLRAVVAQPNYSPHSQGRHCLPWARQRPACSGIPIRSRRDACGPRGAKLRRHRCPAPGSSLSEPGKRKPLSSPSGEESAVTVTKTIVHP